MRKSRRCVLSDERNSGLTEMSTSLGRDFIVKYVTSKLWGAEMTFHSKGASRNV